MMDNLIETAIEIEGLLRVIRDGNPMPETYTLLYKKTSALAEEVKKLKEDDAKEDDLKKEEVASDEEGLAEEESTIAYETLEKEEAEEKNDTATPEEAIATPEEAIAFTEDDNAEPETETDLDINDDEERDEEEDDIFLTLEDEDEEEPTQTVPVAGNVNPATTNTNTSKERKNLKTCFSLNDRFLYARELFGGNMRTFDSTLSQIEQLRDFADVERYVFDELGWSADNQFANAFIETLRNHYK